MTVILYRKTERGIKTNDANNENSMIGILGEETVLK